MIEKEAFEKLIADKPTEIMAKGVLLFNGTSQAAIAYRSEPTSSRLRDLRASETALEEFIESVTKGSLANDRTFPSIPSVVEYLREQGWKISTRTGYNHRDKQILLPRKDGKYYQTDVDNYARSGLLQRLDGTKEESTDADLERKKRADADTAEYVARINKIKAEAIEGKYIERFDYERALSQRAALFKSDIEAFIRGTAEEMVSLVAGDPDKTPDLIEHMLDQFEKCLGRYAEDREFVVPSFSPDDSGHHKDFDED